MPRLVALEMEYFQSIVERTRIEFAPITLLYGPNSAGKSAVFDALEIVKRVWGGPDFVEQEVQKLLRRWAHRAPVDESPEQWTLRSPYFAVEFEFEARNAWDQGAYDSSFSLQDAVDQLEDLPVKVARLEVTFKHDVDRDRFEMAEARISAGGLLWLCIDRSLSAATRSSTLDKVVARERDPESIFVSILETPELSEVLQLYGPREDVLEKEAWYQYGWFVEDQPYPVAYSEVEIRGTNPQAIMRPFFPDSKLSRHVLKCALDIMQYFSRQLMDLLTMSPEVVRADRRIPDPVDAQAFIAPISGYSPRDATVDPDDPVEHFRPIGTAADPHWAFLARAAYSATVVEVAKEATWCRIKQYADRLKDAAAAFDRVNGYLRDELFREKLYQISSKASLLVPVPNRDMLAEEELLLSEPVHVRLLLRDGEGRDIDLYDVGSGLSFVLPVLGAVARDGVCQVQQPELHLHAAVQGDMADVLIDRLNDHSPWQAIVETHSEHLLLRILRRIKDGAKTVVPAKIRASDVAIYYFDPQVAGGTIVTRQAMSPAGDFYLNWPRGFFADREKDLFGE